MGRMSQRDLRKPGGKLPTWEEVLDSFLLAKRADSLAPRTLADYEWHVKRFFTAYPRVWGNGERLQQAVYAYFASLAAMSPAFFNTARKQLRGFFAWCLKQGYIDSNPVTMRQRKEDELPRAASEEALRKLVAYLEKRQHTFTGVRDLGLLLFTLDTGARPSEALSLIPKHFNVQSFEAHIPAPISKTRKPRTVVYSPMTAKAISRMLAIRPPEWPEEAPLFASETGQRLRVSSWGRRLKAYSDALGIKVPPYSLRHSAAIMALRCGATPFYVQRQLGHASLDTTQRYVRLVEADLHRENTACSPVSQLLPVTRRLRSLGT